MENTYFNLWQTIRNEAEQSAAEEPMLASFLHMTVLRHDSLERVLAFHLSSKLANPTMDMRTLYELYLHALEKEPSIGEAVRADITAYYERDPACDQYCLPLLYFKGYHAIQAHRINHCLWKEGRKTLAYFLQNRASEVFGVDIHPAARFGQGIMIDHGTGVVIGETAIIGRHVRLYQAVTLGAKRFTQSEDGSLVKGEPRHPIVEDEVVIYAGATVLGRVTIGRGSVIGGNVWLTRSVPPGSMVSQAGAVTAPEVAEGRIPNDAELWRAFGI